ncbi:MAG: acetyl-CoA C-acyltransferase [Burkholderiales bacterium]|nr:acetyl-CoA C-acyltransferase [Burkholderiales bacterium]
MTDEVVLAGGQRTPFGDFGKSLRDIPLAQLGAHAARACLAGIDLAPERVDHLVFGNVVPVDPDGHFVSRKVALEVGLPIESSAFGVNRACASGSQAIASAAQNVREGLSQISLAGGGESFSRVPYVSQDVRWGAARGPARLDDGLDYAYRCPFSRVLMGETAETLAERLGYRREDMDDWGHMSQRRAQAAIESGFLARQIAPIDVPEGRGTRRMVRDEYPRFDLAREQLARLAPAFRAGGCVTAGSASGVTDGAAAVVVASRAALERNGIAPEARVVAYATAGVPPGDHGCGAGAGDPPASRARGPARARHRLLRDQRGVRGGQPARRARARRPARGHEPLRRRDLDRASARGDRHPHDDHRDAPPAGDRRPLRGDQHVLRGRTGHGDADREPAALRGDGR